MAAAILLGMLGALIGLGIVVLGGLVIGRLLEMRG